MTASATWASLLLATYSAGLAAEPPAPTSRPSETTAVMSAARRARGFLESLAPQMDPIRLRTEHRMKGKKFYVEYLNGWYDLYQLGDPATQKAIHAFLVPIVERTHTPAYHNLETSPDDEFKQDIISYLSACVLHEQLGFDAGDYREQVRRIVPRVLSDKHLKTRGIDNTMGILYRLRQLGYKPQINYRVLWDRDGCVAREHMDLGHLDLSTAAD